MLFNSLPFLFFFTILFALYWFVFSKKLSWQNALLLCASYYFYACWDLRFLSLLIGSSLLNYGLGIWIAQSTNERIKKLLLGIGLLQGIGGLFMFKYLNFFIDSLLSAGDKLNIHLNIHTLNLLLPLGISFYTFKTISYLLDVDKGKIAPVKNWCVFFNYVSFFPGIISGPIDSARTFIPQLEAERVFDYNRAADGLRQILWGMLKKIVIADNCAALTNPIFDDYMSQPASTLIAGAFFYTIQIYADFSGYSDMAIGIAKLLGFNMTRNFEYPFFAQNIAEFWRKWHMSLTSWLTEYVFTPLSIAFRNLDQKGLVLAILVNFTIIGIWHGANWTFVLFGFLHGCYFIPLIMKGTVNKRKKIAKDQRLPSGKEFLNMLLTFLLAMFTFILFRSASIGNAIGYYGKLFSTTVFSKPVFTEKVNVWMILFYGIVMLCVEWVQRDRQHGLQFEHQQQVKPYFAKALRWLVYLLVIFSILCFEGKEQDFIYFKF